MSWPAEVLGDLVDIKGGGTPSKSMPEYWGGTIPWASVKDFKGGILEITEDYITDLAVRGSSTNVIPAGSIIVPTRMALGKVAINKVDMAINQDLKALQIRDESKLLIRYLFRFLESKAQFLESQGKGATVKGITLNVLRDLEIPLPPLPEQKRIAAILDKADVIRRKRQQAIQLADDFLRAVFLDMFGDPVTNPKGWEVDALEQLSTRVTKGESPKWQGFEYGSEGVRFITSENVLWGSLDERMKYIPLEFHQKLKRSQVQEGDLLINLVGASVGRACLAELNGVPANINQAVSVTTLDHSRLLPEIALYQLLVPSMQRVLLGNVVDAARANISLADIRDLQMLVPPTDVQLAFLKVLGKVKKYMAVNSSFSGLNLFESLSHNAFSGQL